MAGCQARELGLKPARVASLMRAIGLVDTPRLSGLNSRASCERRGVRIADPDTLKTLTLEKSMASVVVVQDAFTSFYETQVLLDLLELLLLLGIRPWLARYRPNGKPLHVQGFLGRFETRRRRQRGDLQALRRAGVDLIGIDPSMTMTYRSEYAQALPGRDLPRVHLVQEWLAGRHRCLPRATASEYLLLPHCTERTTAAGTVRRLARRVRGSGLDLVVLPSGCCGMAGT